MEESKIITFSELIKNYRKENKLTQEQFGKLIGKKQGSVSNYEKGVHFPSREEMNLIARVINVPISIVIDAIEYSLKGTIEQHEAFLLDLDRMIESSELQKRYKFMYDGQEVTGEELEKMLKLLKFERFNKQNESN